jgi:hypothetical protein
VELLYAVSDHLWDVTALFFGLWLLPMGWLVLRSGWLPRALGWVLLIGGAGYGVAAFVGSMYTSADTASQLLMLPSIVGELWIMGYLLSKGVRSHGAAALG